ncbi:MAG: response regulator transcription factor [Oscillatoriales cyanobacterium SM2_2_1]|nr:response regulator transcription factor [Oscillatoriales cyanobacterium SM2_2_1]
MRILLVDDEAELTAPLQRVLTGLGYVVDAVNGGADAVELLQHHTYDLLILDWMLPDVSGVELCQQVRARGDSTPVLFLTAKDTLADRIAGLDSGADDYLIKPFELQELLARVRAQLRRSPHASVGPSTIPSPLSCPTYGDLKLDPTNRLVYCRGMPIALSEKECQLLELFLRHPNQTLTHETIQRYLWPEPTATPASNALVAQVRLLRRKIERGNALIHTVYGRGYRFG